MQPDKVLSDAQRTAVDHVGTGAESDRKNAAVRIGKLLRENQIDLDSSQLISGLRSASKVTLNFHPGRLIEDGRSVSESLIADGLYHSQFITGISNGGLRGKNGVDRDEWEERMFGGAYQRTGVDDHERPKYGTLNLLNDTVGGAPRFGSCHLSLKPATLDRTTFSLGDSVTRPPIVTTMHSSGLILAELLETVQLFGVALGQRDMTVRSLVGLSLSSAKRSVRPIPSLDDYIEAQVHGPLRMETDVAALTVDPSFRETDIGNSLVDLACKYSIEINYHDGFQLSAEAFPTAFRGPRIAALAVRVADRYTQDKMITAEVIDRAAQSAVREPSEWSDWDTTEESLQHLKKLWHTLVAYGDPA